MAGADNMICHDWGEGSGLEVHERKCNEDLMGKVSYSYSDELGICFPLNCWMGPKYLTTNSILAVSILTVTAHSFQSPISLNVFIFR